MAIVPQQSSSICRFCLCQDREKLLIIGNIFNSTLAIEDVRRFTGIPIYPDDALRCAICFECLNSLKKSTDFRYACIRNDGAFRQLCLGKTNSVKEEPENSKPVANAVDADPLEFKCDMFELVKAEPIDYIGTEGILNPASGDTIASQNVGGEEYGAPYSANCIELGEPMSDDDACELHKRKEKCKRIKEDTKPAPSLSPSERPTLTEPVMPPPPKQKKPKHPKQLCYMCGVWITCIETHIASHLKETNFACPQCPVKMTNKSNLNRHVRQVHEKRIIISCEQCDKGFTHKNNYLSHMRSHHGIFKTHDCSVCFIKFRHQGALRNHFRSVHLQQQFPCATCGMIFRTPQKVKRHQSVHSTEQRYSCRQCPKRFKYRNARNVHELTHTGIVFKCPHCDKSFRYKGQLGMHVRKIHAESAAQ